MRQTKRIARRQTRTLFYAACAYAATVAMMVWLMFMDFASNPFPWRTLLAAANLYLGGRLAYICLYFKLPHGTWWWAAMTVLCLAMVGLLFFYQVFVERTPGEWGFLF